VRARGAALWQNGACARFWEEPAMYQRILIPVDLADPDFVKPALEAAVALARGSNGTVRLVNVIPMTPVMLAEYVPPDFDVQQKSSAEEALATVAKECGLDAAKVSTVVRQGGIYHEVLEEAKTFGCDLIVMSSHRPAMKTYFLGSNAGHMVRYAKCSVLVVRK
jgi:nucleotide-binding universal stress UspA family protein